MERHRCRSCNTLKGEDEYWYYNDKRRNVGRRREACCKVCRSGERYKRQRSLSGYLKRKISQLKSARTKQGVYFELTADDCIDVYQKQLGMCALSGQTLEYGTPHVDKWASLNISIDRINEDEGYTKDNIQLVCASINFMRGRLPLDVFVGLCRRVAGRHSG